MTDKNLTENKTNSQAREEEIDLGQLFIIIGKGFSKFFNFIGDIFKTIFYWFILFLLFLKINFMKFAIGALFGAVIGGVYHYGIRLKTYESSMTVQPNFGSAVQLYKNIAFYESMVKQEDFKRLAKSLKIDIEEAKSISSMEVEPYSNDNQTLLSYKNFIKDFDSTTVKLINYETFAKEQPVESYKYHIITVTSKDKFIFSKLESPILASIVQNQYYDKVKSTAYLNLNSRKKVLESSMAELDSLRNLYKQIMLEESRKENAGTSIVLAKSGDENKEMLVFDKYMTINQLLIEVNKQLTEENEVINVVSSFNAIGMKVGGWYRNGLVLGFLGGFILVLLVLGIKQINKLLVAYDNKYKPI